jgi:hypothetical protein
LPVEVEGIDRGAVDRPRGRSVRMLKEFKEFIAKGNLVDLASP